jgi:hypothetical protein
MTLRFEFNGELSMQQKLQGSHEFELSGLVPDADGKLVLFVDDEETLAWNVTSAGFAVIED